MLSIEICEKCLSFKRGSYPWQSRYPNAWLCDQHQVVHVLKNDSKIPFECYYELEHIMETQDDE